MGMAKHVVNMCVNTDMHTGRDIERLAQSLLVQSEPITRKAWPRFCRKDATPRFKGVSDAITRTGCRYSPNGISSPSGTGTSKTFSVNEISV